MAGAGGKHENIRKPPEIFANHAADAQPSFGN
jgi:hypothetical protein